MAFGESPSQPRRAKNGGLSRPVYAIWVEPDSLGVGRPVFVCSIVPRSGPRRSEGNTGLDRRAGRHRSLSKCATVLPHGDLARSPRRSRQRAKKGRFLGRRALRGIQPADAKRRTGTRQLSETRSLAGQTASRVGRNGWTRETTP